MNSARKLLRFEDFDADVFIRRAPKQTTANQHALDVLQEITTRHGNSAYKPLDRVDLRQIYHRFRQARQRDVLQREFGSLKRTRQLAWTLTYSEDGLPRIVDIPELRDALEVIENHLRTSALLGIFDALLQAWDTPNAVILRAFIKKHLTTYNGSRTSVERLKANMAWYCEKNGVTELVMELLRSQVKLCDLWSYLELPEHMHSYSYFGAVAEAYIALYGKLDTAAVADVVAFVNKHNNDKTCRAVLSKLIEQLESDAPDEIREPLQTYCLREWQDPRIAGAEVRWRGVSDEARRIFAGWITREDLRFFFDVVAQACNDPKFAYRKAFWLAYLERINSCRVVLRANSEYLFKNDRYYREQQSRVATLRGGGANQHAFIIQMGNHVFVEFSTAGACYVYDRVAAREYQPEPKIEPSPLGFKRFVEYLRNFSGTSDGHVPYSLSDSEYRIGRLRNRLRSAHRVVHRNSEDYSWQDRFAAWLNRELGIAPLRSFRLED